MNTDVCIIGAGPAGLMTAVHCAGRGALVSVIESNTVAGRKLLLTGAGRCNFTHIATTDQLISAFNKKGRFLSYAFHKFPPQQVIEFFARAGVPSKIEPTGCVFVASQKAADVRDTLVKQALAAGAKIIYGRTVERISKQGDGFHLVTAKENIIARKIVIATGGRSLPKTGSTGAGYKFAEQLGHTIITPRPALVPLITKQKWVKKIAGLAVYNVRISAKPPGKKLSFTGPMIFTNDGIGGPAVLDLSREITDLLPNKENPVTVDIDLLPCIDRAVLHKTLLEKFAANPKKTVSNIIADLLPKRLATILCSQANIDEKISACQLTKQARASLLNLLKSLPLAIVSTRPIAEATITRGGVDLEQVDAKTMQSKICPGLYFAGEVLDIAGPCGGYNLQACWSTAFVAAASII